MDQVEFRLPPDALVPLPGSVPPPRRRPAAAPTSGDPFDAFGSAPAEAAAARDDFADLESLGAIGAPQAQAAAGQTNPFFLYTFCWFYRVCHSSKLACLFMPSNNALDLARTCTPAQARAHISLFPQTTCMLMFMPAASLYFCHHFLRGVCCVLQRQIRLPTCLEAWT